MLLKFLENEPAFLLAFNIPIPSYFFSLAFFVHLYLVSLDPYLRVGLNAFSRYIEMRADTFSVNLGLGLS